MSSGVYVPHCYEECCSLGSFHYECPACGNEVVDYDMWSTENDVILAGATPEFACEDCKARLRVRYDDDAGAIRVEILVPSPPEA
jgi:hypothetical protein